MAWIRHERPDGLRSLWREYRSYGQEVWCIVTIAGGSALDTFEMFRYIGDEDPRQNRLKYLQAECAEISINAPTEQDVSWLWRRQ